MMIRSKNLPGWLQAFIYGDMGGSYEPDRDAFQNNLFSDEEKNSLKEKNFLERVLPCLMLFVVQGQLHITSKIDLILL